MGGSNYDSVFYEEIGKVEDNHFWFRHRKEVIVNLILRYAGAPKGFRMLDVGSGTCSIAACIARSFSLSRVYCTDLNIQGLKDGRKKFGVRAAMLDMRSGALKCKFDVIGMFDVLEHIEDDEGMIRTAAKNLTDNGTLMVTVPFGPQLWSNFDIVSGHQRRYLKEELRSKLGSAGFDVCYLSHLFSFLAPLMFLSRGRKEQGRDDIAAEVRRQLNPPPAVNFLFRCMLKPEGMIMRMGGVIPYGSSLIAVAKKRLST